MLQTGLMDIRGRVGAESDPPVVLAAVEIAREEIKRRICLTLSELTLCGHGEKVGEGSSWEEHGLDVTVTVT